MPILHAIVLGIVQGLSEFLPISSSGHLIIAPWLFGWEELTRDPELNRTFDVALHLGTFAGALGYFRRDAVSLSVAGLRALRRRRIVEPDERFALLLLVSSLPAAVTGLALDSVIEGNFAGEIVIGVMLVVFGLVLFAADRLRGDRHEADYRGRDALLMGAAQAMALVPGVSRSGATMSMGRALGFARDDAARLSFLMSLPIIGGAGLYEGIRTFAGEGIPAGFAPAFAWGVVASAVTGFAAVWGLLRVLRTRSFVPFVVYRVIAGVGVVAIALSR